MKIDPQFVLEQAWNLVHRIQREPIYLAAWKLRLFSFVNSKGLARTNMHHSLGVIREDQALVVQNTFGVFGCATNALKVELEEDFDLFGGQHISLIVQVLVHS